MKQRRMADELTSQLEAHSDRIQRSLSDKLDREVERSSLYHPFISNMFDSIKEFVLRGGKRMASFTTSLVSKGYGFENPDALEAACDAVELYRHSILIHDDLVDGDDLRRGKPTLNRRYTNVRDERLGLGCSVFSGNILFCLSLQRILSSPLERDIAALVAGELVRANSEVNESQILDLHMEGTDSDPVAWQTMASKRAASLFRATLRIGGILPGAMDELEILGRAGEEMGYVFDIQDDIIDTLASRSEYGRQPGSDLRTMKRPLHVILAMDRSSPSDRVALASPSTDLTTIKRILQDTGAVNEAKLVARKHESTALGLIGRTSMSDEAKNLLESLMVYMRDSLKWYE